MKNCINCGDSLELNALFCPQCGTKQPENNPENRSNPLVGDKNIISTSGGDITGTKITGGNVNFTTVNHAQDDTKKRIRCFYTGQGVALEDLMNCPSCKKDVAKAYYNSNNQRCYHCDDTAKEEYTRLMRDYLSDGRIDPTEIKKLQMHQAKLLLTDDETKNIEKSERERLTFVKTSNISENELRDLDFLSKLFEQNKHIKQGDSIISVLYKKYPQSPDVSFYYFLNEFEKKDTKLYDLALSTREDNLFAYYFGGVAAELEGKTDESQKIIEKLSLVYDEYFYLNDALKLLSLAEKFDYQSNKLIIDKIVSLLSEVYNASINGIYLSAYLGLISYVDNYCCNAQNAKLISKHSDATSAALGYFFINIREQKLLSEKRKIEAQKQAELERIELEKIVKKRAEEIAKAEALRIEQEKKEKLEREKLERKQAEEKAKAEEKRLETERKKEIEHYKKIQLEKYKEEKRKEQIKKNERRKEFFNSIIGWFLEKDSKGSSSRLFVTGALLFFIILFKFWIIPENLNKKNLEKEALALSSNLEKKYEEVNLYILNNQIDRAKSMLPNLVHPSDLPSP